MADVRQRLAVGANVLDDEGLDPRTNGRITSLRRARVTSVWPFMIVLLIVLFLYWERHKLGTRWKQLQDEGKSNEKTQGSLEKEASQLHKNGDRRKRVRPDPPSVFIAPEPRPPLLFTLISPGLALDSSCVSCRPSHVPAPTE